MGICVFCSFFFYAPPPHKAAAQVEAVGSRAEEQEITRLDHMRNANAEKQRVIDSFEQAQQLHTNR